MGKASVFGGESQRTAKGRIDFIRYAGVVDFDALYKRVVKWFNKRGYDFYEVLYKDKPPELEIEWHAERKLDDFYKYHMEIYFHIFDIEEVEAIKDGKKKKMMKCRFWVNFDPKVEYDWQGRWSKNEFTKKLLDFYIKFVIRREFQLNIADPFWYITYDLHNIFKEQLGMETAGNVR
ncbi:MAG: hypothetical protein MAG795_00484 [Candidatus Woesearchaeota archaeon]|nr:hypothetical protein [Candidatus Woesearchaeota archaeon]